MISLRIDDTHRGVEYRVNQPSKNFNCRSISFAYNKKKNTNFDRKLLQLL